MNKVEILGRLTKDPEITYGGENNQTVICRFTVAVNRRGKDSEADFINCIAFGKTAEFIGKYFNKGSQLALVGRIQVSQYQDIEGNKKSSTNVLAEEVFFAGTKVENKTTTETQDWDDTSDLPF